jgi:hypothetical protein
MIVLLLAGGAWATDFETPPEEPAASSLPPELAAGTNFHVKEPVQSDGLMHHYLIESSFGEFAAYDGREAGGERCEDGQAGRDQSRRHDHRHTEGHRPSFQWV